MCLKTLLEEMRTWESPVRMLGARCYYDSLRAAPWTTKKNQRFSYMALNGTTSKEIEEGSMIQGVIVDF
jgi:hypothetical protein